MIRRPPKPDPQQHLKTRAGACVMKWAFYVTLSFFRWQFFQFSVSPTLQCYNAQCLSDLLLLFHTHVWRQLVIALRRPFVIFYRTQVNASYSTWWPTLQTMQVAPPDDQMLNQSKLWHLVAKYVTYTCGTIWWSNCATNASGAIWLPNLQPTQVTSQFLGPLCLWQCFFRCLNLTRSYDEWGPIERRQYVAITDELTPSCYIMLVLINHPIQGTMSTQSKMNLKGETEDRANSESESPLQWSS